MCGALIVAPYPITLILTALAFLSKDGQQETHCGESS